jgi:putative ABC transport system permease protein
MALPLKYNLRNITQRWSTTLGTALTIGLTIGVFLLVMALASGIDKSLTSSGEPLNVIVVRQSSTAELNSSISKEQFNVLKNLEGITKVGDQPLVAPEMITLIYKARKGNTQGSNITIRGIGPMSNQLRSGFKLTAGKMFQSGMAEAVVSDRIAQRFQGLEVGDKFRIQATDYVVVGLFQSGGKAFESEIWVDVNSLANATKRDSYSSVLLRAKDQASLDAIVKRITDDKQLKLKALSERKFYEDQQGDASGLLKGLAAFIAVIMAIGAAFAGMNSMYAAVAKRTKEIGTLRVLGFGRGSILLSFVLESVAIGLVGAVIAVVITLPLNFVSTGTSNFTNFSEMAFNFRVGWDLVLIALGFGILIGLFGSLLPAIRASRFKIVDALRT